MLNPFHIARKGLYLNIKDLSGHIRGKTLDVGCGRKPYEKLFASTEYVGLEIDTEENRRDKKADVYYDGVSFPFADSEFDSVVSSQVFEHVFRPGEFLDEIHRVLKKDGTLLLTVPFVWDEHEQPNDFARYSSFGVSSLLEARGFEVVEIRKSVSGIRVIFQMLNAYIYKTTVTGNRFLNAAVAAAFMFPFNLLGGILGRILPDNRDLYLDNVVLTRKIKSATGAADGN